ncbi:MAG TPA: bifunctional 4-hydroxy-2-oxoglutarate aldolase/2-dehydro-3-deoxy-phosphogluconate aldolase [Gemmatimonadales bacterium]|nr:bifunctional 4-hydroxy-2-oxoglutarate aldolase/2-dehydro-3-deoxy-phosphogluconate aldolase [Gemmatimonadales bacterium]
MSGVLETLRRLRLLPLVVIDDPGRADGLARALADGGLPVAEIAFRTPAAVEALRRVAAGHPDVLVGAGTVLTPDQAATARGAGARFVVSPGLDRRVVDWCRAHDLAVFPGVCTPTEIAAAVAMGLEVLKFFPAEPMGGLPFLQAVAAPFAGVEFIPTGGLAASHLPAYLGCRRVVACGGSWMAPQAWIAEGQFDRIRRAVEDSVRLAATPPAGA